MVRGMLLISFLLTSCTVNLNNGNGAVTSKKGAPNIEVGSEDDVKLDESLLK